MKMTKSDNVVIQFPLLGILGLIFITLKLTGHITWSWWWVLAPFWGPLVFVIIILMIAFLIELLIKK